MAGENNRRGGCVGGLVKLLGFVGLIALGCGLYFVSQSQDLTDLTTSLERQETAPRDLREVLEKALDGDYGISLSEGEINSYLRRVVEAKQGGQLDKWVKLENVYVRLEEGRAEVVLERSVMDYPFTVSMYLRVVDSNSANGTPMRGIMRNGGPYHPSLPVPSIGGRFGRLSVPEGFLYLVLPSFSELVKLFRDASSQNSRLEIDMIEQMAQITIEPGVLSLEPLPPVNDIEPSTGQ